MSWPRINLDGVVAVEADHRGELIAVRTFSATVAPLSARDGAPAPEDPATEEPAYESQCFREGSGMHRAAAAFQRQADAFFRGGAR